MQIITPDWPAAKNIHAFCTTRKSPEQNKTQVKGAAYADFNLALHVDDNPEQVNVNRQQLLKYYKLPTEPVWLNQVHGCQVIEVPHSHSPSPPTADAAFTRTAEQLCTVMTADCLPLLICNRRGNKVAAAHAGWRGLAAGVIETSVAQFNEKPTELLVWLGPAIGAEVFEVGSEVRDIFINKQAQSAAAFKENRAGYYLADIYQLARLRLQSMGIDAVYGGEYCTFTDVDHFYSYRRDGTTGRQASLIWFE